MKSLAPNPSSAGRWLMVFGLAVVVAVAAADAEEPKETPLDGIYTTPNTMINAEGREQVAFQFDRETLELRGDQFRYWFFSDCMGEEKYPIAGIFEKQGDVIVLRRDPWSKRYVSATVNGVSGLWTEEGLAKWTDGKQAMNPAILVRVADGPVVGDIPQDEKFKYPSILPLFNPEDVREFWAKEKQDHEDRCSDLQEPLKTFLRKRSDRDDSNLDAYRAAVRKFQKIPDPVLLGQMVEVMGSGPHQVVATLALDDLFLSSQLAPGPPAFMASPEERGKALDLLVDAFRRAKDPDALTQIILVFLEASGIHQMELRLSDGQILKFARKDGATSYRTFKYSATATDECQAWARSRLKEPLPVADPAK